MQEDDDFRMAEIERSISELTYTANRLEQLHQQWEQNQKWQLNNVLQQLTRMSSHVSLMLGLIFGAVAYIAYKMP